MNAFPRPGELAEDPHAPFGKLAAHDKARVMLVDDSITVRTVFARMLGRQAEFEIIAQAGTAEQALLKLRGTEVDVILLDLEMPGMGGLDALPKLIDAGRGAQILVVSSLTRDGAEATLSALAMGAADTMLKPRPGGFDDKYQDTLLEKVRALAGNDRGSAPLPAKDLPPATIRRVFPTPRAVAIGASTGGIHALSNLLRELPDSFDLPILITQHLPASFIPVFARQMELAAKREAVLADSGVEVKKNRIVIAPGHGHMTVKREGERIFTALDYSPAKSGCMPSVDPMLASCAEAFDGRIAGVILSGMGRDGSEGAALVSRAGGPILAQDEESSAVWGMPRGVVENGIASSVLSPGDLAARLCELAGVSQPC